MILRTLHSDGSVTVDECCRYIATRNVPGAITLKLLGSIDGQQRTITLPRDGHTVYVMSSYGDTVDRYTVNGNGNGNGSSNTKGGSHHGREAEAAGSGADEAVSPNPR